MEWSELTIGWAITGSFCTFAQTFPEIQKIKEVGAKVIPIMSENARTLDTRFGKASDHIQRFEMMTENKLIGTIAEAEPFGPKGILDILVIAPCTGNTLAKIANAITDSTVTMAAKAHLRNQKPLVIAISTNDALALNAKNLGILLNSQSVYFVPFRQDDPKKKSNSLVAKMELVIPTIQSALQGLQIQPIYYVED